MAHFGVCRSSKADLSMPMKELSPMTQPCLPIPHKQRRIERLLIALAADAHFPFDGVDGAPRRWSLLVRLFHPLFHADCRVRQWRGPGFDSVRPLTATYSFWPESPGIRRSPSPRGTSIHRPTPSVEFFRRWAQNWAQGPKLPKRKRRDRESTQRSSLRRHWLLDGAGNRNRTCKVPSTGGF
jgi:hypothetical protein